MDKLSTINNTNILPRFPGPSEHYGPLLFCPPPPLSPALPRQNRLKKLHIINFNLIHQSTNQRIAGKITTGGYRYLAFYNPPLICVNIQIIWYCDVKPQMRIFAIERLHSFHRDQLHVRHGSHVGVPDKRIQSKLF